jgi:hypothetical protein
MKQSENSQEMPGRQLSRGFQPRTTDTHRAFFLNLELLGKGRHFVLKFCGLNMGL